MIAQCVAAVCTLGIVILAILVMTRAISLEDALKAIGKTFLLIVVVYFAACMLGPFLHAGVVALIDLLTAVLHWLVVTVFITVPLMLLVRVFMRKYMPRSSAKSNRHRGDE